MVQGKHKGYTKKNIMSVADRFKQIKSKLPEGVKLVAVSKTQSVEKIMEAYGCGHRIFGESKAQELIQKQAGLPPDIEWHMVGHLQSNKVKYIAPFISLIHSVDSLKLLRIIDKEGHKNKRIIPCLLQVHIADESSKFGFSFEEVWQILERENIEQLNHIDIQGLMGMATFTDDLDQVREEFRYLKSSFDRIRNKFFAKKPTFSNISMGMTGDYQIGVEEGSTIVRIGTALFGDR